jgi:hypothetical protein
MQRFFLICALAIVASAVMAPAARAMLDRPTTDQTVRNNCAGMLQSALGAFGCTICNDSGTKCTDWSCNYNPLNGARYGCFAVSFTRRQPSPQATPMSVWAPGWLSRNNAQ